MLAPSLLVGAAVGVVIIVGEGGVGVEVPVTKTTQLEGASAATVVVGRISELESVVLVPLLSIASVVPKCMYGVDGMLTIGPSHLWRGELGIPRTVKARISLLARRSRVA